MDFLSTILLHIQNSSSDTKITKEQGENFLGILSNNISGNDALEKIEEMPRDLRVVTWKLIAAATTDNSPETKHLRVLFEEAFKNKDNIAEIKEAIKEIEKLHTDVFSIYDKNKNLFFSEEIERAITENPIFFLNYLKENKDAFPEYKNFVTSDHIWGDTIDSIANEQPHKFALIFNVWEDHKDTIPSATLTVIADDNPELFINAAKKFDSDFDRFKPDISYIFKDHPELLLANYNMLSKLPEFKLQNSQLLMDTAAKTPEKFLFFIEKYPNDKNDFINEIKSTIMNNIEQRFQEGFQNSLKDDVEDGYINPGMDVIHTTNFLHLSPDNERFAILDKLSQSSLFSMLGFNGFAAIPSSFTKILSDFIEKSKESDETFTDMLKRTGQESQLIEALENISAYSREDELFSILDPEEKIQIFDKLFDYIENIEPSSAHIVAEYINKLPQDDPLIPYIEAKILQGFTNEDSYYKDSFGILASWYANNSKHQVSPENVKAFNTITNDPLYKLPDFSSFENKTAFDSHNTSHHLFLFYEEDDKDGSLSFSNFNKSMLANGWKKHHDSSINSDIFSKTQNGKEIKVYTTTLKGDSNGHTILPGEMDKVDVIKDTIRKDGGFVGLMAHRGHIYYLENTIEKLDSETRILFSGACNGASRTEGIDSDKHVIATVGEGTMYVNDPAYIQLTRDLLTKDAILWEKYHEIISNYGHSEAQGYRTPDQNLNIIFSNKLSEIQDLRSKDDSSEISKQFENAHSGDTESQRNAQEIPEHLTSVNAHAILTH
jgi:hypothetical protein